MECLFQQTRNKNDKNPIAMKPSSLLISMLLLLLPTGAMAQFTWKASDGKAQVVTGLGTDSHTEGIWRKVDDSGDGGKSKIIWADGTEVDHPTDNMVKTYGGISGTAQLNQGSLTYQPFAGIAFDVVGEDWITGDLLAGDASAWDGITISYASSVPMTIELSLGEVVDQAIGYHYPTATIPKIRYIV
jgi:hypothetical protein